MITLFSLVCSTLYGLDYETSWHGLRKLERLGLITLYSAAFGFLNVEQFFMAAMYVSFSDKKSFLCPPVRIGRLIFVGVIILMSLSLISVRHGFTKSLEDVNVYMNYISVIFTFFAIVAILANLSLVFFLSRDDCAQGDRGQSRRQATVTIVLNTFLFCSCVPIIAFLYSVRIFVFKMQFPFQNTPHKIAGILLSVYHIIFPIMYVIRIPEP